MGLNRLTAEPHNALPPGNATAEAIVARLPARPLVNAREVADALFTQTTAPVFQFTRPQGARRDYCSMLMKST